MKNAWRLATGKIRSTTQPWHSGAAFQADRQRAFCDCCISRLPTELASYLMRLYNIHENAPEIHGAILSHLEGHPRQSDGIEH